MPTIVASYFNDGFNSWDKNESSGTISEMTESGRAFARFNKPSDGWNVLTLSTTSSHLGTTGNKIFFDFRSSGNCDYLQCGQYQSDIDISYDTDGIQNESSANALDKRPFPTAALFSGYNKWYNCAIELAPSNIRNYYARLDDGSLPWNVPLSTWQSLGSNDGNPPSVDFTTGEVYFLFHLYTGGVNVDTARFIWTSDGTIAPPPPSGLTVSTPAGPFIRGDVNADGLVNQADLDLLIQITLGQASVPAIWQRADVNNNGVINIGDVQYLASYLSGGNPPPAPFPTAGYQTDPYTTLQLSWSNNQNGYLQTGFKIERSTISSGPFVQIATTTSTSFVDTHLSPNTTYYYRIRSYYTYGGVDYNSAYSNSGHEKTFSNEKIIYDSSFFYNSNNQGWSDYTLVKAPIHIHNGFKRMVGSGVLIDQLGFLRNPGTVSQTGMIFQIDVTIEKQITQAIFLAGIGRDPFLHDANTASILFNTFLSGQQIRFNDYGENQVSGGVPIATFTVDKTYTLKFLINDNGTCSAFVSCFELSLFNVLLGTTTTANNLLGVPVYFSTNQTFTNPNTSGTRWTNFFVHNQGLNFIPSRREMDLLNMDNILKEDYH